MQHLDAALTRACTPYAALIPALEAAVQRLDDGAIQAPERAVLPLQGGARYLVMPAADARLVLTKLVTVHPGNAALGLPAIRGSVCVADARDGRPLALIDGPTLTARRTAALSMLGMRRLHPGPLRRVAIVGSGRQAEEHAIAVHETFAARVVVASRTPAHAEVLCARLAAQGIDAVAAADVPAALAGADAVVTATTSRTPVLPTELPAHCLVVAIGAFTPEMAEVPPALLRKRSIVVDTLAGARHEAGDLLQAGIDWAAVRPMAQALREPPRPGQVFKTVGHAAWDLAAAAVALDVAAGLAAPPG